MYVCACTDEEEYHKEEGLEVEKCRLERISWSQLQKNKRSMYHDSSTGCEKSNSEHLISDAEKRS